MGADGAWEVAAPEAAMGTCRMAAGNAYGAAARGVEDGTEDVRTRGIRHIEGLGRRDRVRRDTGVYGCGGVVWA